MASKRFKIVLAIRTLSNFVVIVALVSLAFEFGPVILAEATFRKDQILGISRTVDLDTSIDQPATSSTGSVVLPQSSPQAKFGSFLNLAPQTITPVSADYGIVIEKINANAKVVPNVNPSDEKSYTSALAQGVAAVAGSTVPGEPGNLYIFSHSTDAPWNIIRFNAIFYLLRELELGDRVVMFYKGRRFDYIVYDKQIASPSDLDFLRNRYDQPVLTLQTCDPPGTLLNRLIVRAKLEGF
ncbi:hypothetical protein A2631_01085 [Candidatus Daviesbacteria bacterium RIFCSPHIGHO2_01_FULL_44_29]|uniref:Sortase n=1 Tax=Candidatus Daviesbacteria bacterium RIFCSPHIGHO2_02_FULL_43_12 TaxID=1797776 RepID=A0A1F5KIJ3_9BACT|nr:MAG: hypothetical protein A2631_01085 [Candidatus Daviesbacteria bacterium RIFCSPHIGHO2_01_FULL_44_29]OGE40422.1 MAG: hypothetical protein A3E86_03200 [Candidatus Daviesbacteria bacterium RIFCSPHIGHO2_12_FULL_47_45]OGE40732.1 MAG: hypothetical protein A3D25_05660 [Candidatus Daviesbacteria bacterium RIFCSPHIGHO2_02_FULL_43_12]OGE69771.1 MAG: hypothetical protein A3B55_05150 [Candidatus Daviesbacteria bacterium RIFCSPLOWO2_01_FULL_43_15]